jgi:hypothetical protein
VCGLARVYVCEGLVVGSGIEAAADSAFWLGIRWAEIVIVEEKIMIGRRIRKTMRKRRRRR